MDINENSRGVTFPCKDRPNIIRDVIISFSGGADSTAAALEALRVYDKNRIELVFMDTGAEYKGTRDHVELVAGMLELPLTILNPKRDWFEQVRHDKFPFTPALRKCTHTLKLDTFNKWLRLEHPENNLTIVTGIRGEESSRRSKLTEWDVDNKGNRMWRPALHMSKAEVKERTTAEGLPIHYCYEFSSRCNCWLCVFAGYNEIRTYAEMNPDEWEKACLLEDEIHHPVIQKGNINDLMKQGRLL